MDAAQNPNLTDEAAEVATETPAAPAPASTPAKPKSRLAEDVSQRLGRDDDEPLKVSTPPAAEEPKSKPKSDKMVPVAAVSELRKENRSLRERLDQMQSVIDRKVGLEEELLKKFEERTDRPATKSEFDAYVEQNANDPVAKEILALRSKLQAAEETQAATQKQFQEISESQAREWVVEQIDGARQNFPMLKEILEVGADGELNQRLADFLVWAGKRGVDNEDDFKIAMRGYFADDLERHAVEQAREQTVRRASDAQHAARVVSAPGTAAGTPSAFGRSSSLQQRILERLKAQAG